MSHNVGEEKPDWQKDKKNYIISKLRPFAHEVSIIGVRYTVDGSKTWIGKLMWTLLVLLGMGLAIYQIADRVNYFLQFPTSSDLDIEQNEVIRFPQVTICNQNTVSKRAANSTGLMNVLSLMFPLFEGYTPTPDLSAFNNMNWTDETIIELQKELAPSFENKIYFCLWKGLPCNMSWFEPIFTNMGYCLTFNSGDTNLTSSSAGASEGLFLILENEQYDYLVTNPMSMDAGYRVLIHDQGEVPLLRELGLQVSVAFCTAIVIAQRKNNLLGAPYGNCNSTSGYTQSACYLECLAEYVVKRCKCRDIYMPGNASICSIVQVYNANSTLELLPGINHGLVYNCSSKAVASFPTDVDGSLSCNCPSQCSSTYYDFKTSQSVFSWHALDFIQYMLKLTGNDATIFDITYSSAPIQIYFSTMQTQAVTTSAAYSFMALLSDIGGALGLLLGATLLTVFEVIDFAVHFAYDVMKMKKRNKSEIGEKRVVSTMQARVVTVSSAVD